MIPKVETCIYALEQGVEGVVILDGKVPHAVLLELLTDHGAGTLITRWTDSSQGTGDASISTAQPAPPTPHGTRRHVRRQVRSPCRFPRRLLRRHRVSTMSRPGSSISTTRSIRAHAQLWPRSTSGSRCFWRDMFGLDGMSAPGAAEVLLHALRHDAEAG